MYRISDKLTLRRTPQTGAYSALQCFQRSGSNGRQQFLSRGHVCWERHSSRQKAHPLDGYHSYRIFLRGRVLQPTGWKYVLPLWAALARGKDAIDWLQLAQMAALQFGCTEMSYSISSCVTSQCWNPSSALLRRTTSPLPCSAESPARPCVRSKSALRFVKYVFERYHCKMRRCGPLNLTLASEVCLGNSTGWSKQWGSDN